MGVYEVGYVPILSTTTPGSSLLSIFLPAPPVLLVPVYTVFIYASATIMLLLSLLSVLISVLITATTLALLSNFSSLVAHSAVIDLVGVFRLQSRIVA